MGQDTSGLVKIDVPGANPLFLNPEDNRFVDFSDNIEVDNPAEAIPRITYPKVSKTPLIKYPSKRDATKGQNREIFPGVSDKAWDSWTESVKQFPADVAGHAETLGGFQTIRDYISAVTGQEDVTLDTPIVDTPAASELRDLLFALQKFLKPGYGDKPITDDQYDALGFDIDSATSKLINLKVEEITVADILPEIMLDFPISASPFEGWNKWQHPGTGYSSTWRAFTGNSWRYNAPPSRQVGLLLIKAIATGDDNDYITAFDALQERAQSAQQEMTQLIARFRTPGNKQSAVSTRRMAQLGFEIDALERMADKYFTDDKISAAVTRRTRATYRRGVDSANKQRERAERRAAGELKVGGKLQVEALRPQAGVVRDGDSIRTIMEEHKSPQLFSEINLLDTAQAVPLLSDDEIDYLDQVQDAYLTSTLPDGRVVNWAGGMNQSIAELYMALELNGYNDPPVQVSTAEAEQMLVEKDESGKPRWFMMTRYLNTNSSEPGKSPASMVAEYREGPRFPIGQGSSAGGRGDNFAGGSGYSGYGPSGIVALVSADSRIADRQFLGAVESNLQKLLTQMAEARQVSMASFTPTSADAVDIDELMALTDTLKSAIDFSNTGRYSTSYTAGSPLANEARALVFTLAEHWLQLEMAKIDNPTSEADIAWNKRLVNMQTGIYKMDEAQIALFAGYDGYFSQTPSWLTGSAEQSDWPQHTPKDFGGNQIMWLNRTALAVLDNTATYDEASRLSRL